MKMINRKKKVQKSISFSVIIPTYGRETVLVDCLKTIIKQDYDDYEIIVIDQTPVHSKQTVKFLNQNRKRIRLINESIPNVCRARNIGISHAKGEVVLFLDDDILADEKLIHWHSVTYDQHDSDGVAGMILNPGSPIVEKQPAEYYKSRLKWLHTRFDHKEAGWVPHAAGGNMSFKKDIVEKLDGWDETYIGNSYREETDFCMRFGKAGYKIYYQPEARLIHLNPDEGGQHNELISSTRTESHRFHVLFIRNNIYFYLKNISIKYFPFLIYKLYRDNVLNRAYIKAGIVFLLRRHIAWIIGVMKGFLVWLSKTGKKKGDLWRYLHL